MRHVKWWCGFLGKCGAATWLVHTATGLAWLQALAWVTLALWVALEALRALERLLAAFLWHSDDDDGNEGPEAEPPIMIHADTTKQQEWRN